jgi:lipoate-protein ligase A
VNVSRDVSLPTEPVEPAVAFAESLELLRSIAKGQLDRHRLVRIYTPTPTLALSRWESRQPGFQKAATSARAQGFDPAIRPTGGRAAAYDESCLIFDLVVAERAVLDPRPFFEETSSRIAGVLRDFGVDARVGPVEGEYCPGEFSINARGEVKLVGTSQRAVPGARLLSGVLPLGGVEQLVPVLTSANESLGLRWDESSFGSVATEAQGFERADIAAALATALRGA